MSWADSWLRLSSMEATQQSDWELRCLSDESTDSPDGMASHV